MSNIYIQEPPTSGKVNYILLKFVKKLVCMFCIKGTYENNCW